MRTVRTLPRQHVEALVIVGRDDDGVITSRLPDERERLGIIPRAPIDQRATGSVQRALQTEQLVVTARCAPSLRAAHMHHAVARNAIRCQLSQADRLASERFHRIATQSCDRHAHLTGSGKVGITGCEEATAQHRRTDVSVSSNRSYADLPQGIRGQRRNRDACNRAQKQRWRERRNRTRLGGIHHILVIAWPVRTAPRCVSPHCSTQPPSSRWPSAKPARISCAGAN